MRWFRFHRRTRTPIPADGDLFGLQPFDPQHAETVAEWVRSDRELFWLSPRTPAPLTATKITRWGRGQGCQLVYRAPRESDPCAYAELNEMPEGHDHWWLGHCLVAPSRRGQGLGGRIVRLLLECAFLVRHAQRVSLVVFPENVGAVRCYRRAGLSERGDVYRRFATRDGTHRMLYMSIDRHEFAYHRGYPDAQHLPDLAQVVRGLTVAP